MQVCGVLVARGRLKNSATKKLCAEVFFIRNGHFWEMHKENKAFL